MPRRKPRQQAPRERAQAAPRPTQLSPRPRAGARNPARSFIYRRPLQALLLFMAFFLSAALGLNAIHVVRLRSADLLGLAFGVLAGVTTLYAMEWRRVRQQQSREPQEKRRPGPR